MLHEGLVGQWVSVHWDVRTDPHPLLDPTMPREKPTPSRSTASATGSSTTTPWSTGARSPSGSIGRRSGAWQYQGPPQQGAQFRYSDTAIQCVLTLRAVYHLPLRATEGFARSILGLMGLDLDVPDYSTLCRRAKALQITLPKKADGPLHLVIDSTGLKVYGEGEWKVRQHGYSKRRTWLKLHLAIDPESHEIRAAMVSEPGVTDAEAVPDLLAQEEGPVEGGRGRRGLRPARRVRGVGASWGQGDHPAPAGCEDHPARQYVGAPAGPGREPATDPEDRPGGVEGGVGVSPAVAGGDGDVPDEDDLRGRGGESEVRSGRPRRWASGAGR